MDSLETTADNPEKQRRRNQPTFVALSAGCTILFLAGILLLLSAFFPGCANRALASDNPCIHVSYQWYQTDKSVIEDYETFDVPATVEGDRLYATVMPEAFSLDNECTWRVMKNFAGGIPAGEHDITFVTNYEASSGKLSLSASRANEDLTIIFVMPWDHESHQTHGHFHGTTEARFNAIDCELHSMSIDSLDVASNDMLSTASTNKLVAGAVFPLTIFSGANGLESDPMIYGADTNVTGAGTVMGYPELNGRYKFYVSFIESNCELFQITKQIPGRQGNGGTIYGGSGTPYDYSWARNYKWCVADCIENVYNTAGMPVPLNGSGSWVRIDSISGSTINCTFRIECNNPDGSNAQDIMGTFSLTMPMGGIALQKTSSNTSITDNNACYSLAGAKYGVFETSAKALTRNESAALATYTTNDAGIWQSGMDYSAGTYYVTELSAPKGFALNEEVIRVVVNGGEIASVSTAEAPLAGPATMQLQKQDVTTGTHAQGDASLAGAEITFCYYDGYYSASNLPETPTRTIVVPTNENGIASPANSGVETHDANSYYYDEHGSVVFPLGTITAIETKAPEGYTLGSPTLYVFHITQNDNGTSAQSQLVSPSNSPTTNEGALIISNAISRGRLILGKTSRETQDYLEQGAASLEGWTFEIINRSVHSVIVDGVEYQPGDVVKSISSFESNGIFIADTGEHNLPYGTYEVREIETMHPQANGYLLDDTSASWSYVFSIQTDGETINLTDPTEGCSNQVVRGDLELIKVKSPEMQRLAGIPFKVTSVTTGEWHIVVTDRNGYISTSSSLNSHSFNTNGNDRALAEDGTIDESLFDENAGIWFSGRSDITTEPNENKGALPFDTYIVEELPVKANEGLELLTVEARVYRDNFVINLGTLENTAKVLPGIETTLSDSNGKRSTTASGETMLIDAVSYTNLQPSESYTLFGELYLLEEGQTTTQVATSECSFTPNQPHGTTNVEFAVDTAELSGQSIVCFEHLYNAEGVELINHADANNESQTVLVEQPKRPTPPPDTDKPDEPAPPEDTDEPNEEAEEPKPEKPMTPHEPEKDEPAKSTLVKTGDNMPFSIFMLLIPAGAIGLALAALMIRKLEQERRITIEKGSPRMR